MPYPTEHVAKIESVVGFNPTTLLRRKLGGGISVIVGNRQDDETKIVTQSYRFDAKRFSPDAARKWIKDHDAKILSFEPATNESSVRENVAAIMAQSGVPAGLVVNEDGVTAVAKDDDLAANAGTSEGAKKAWDTRGRGQKDADISLIDKWLDGMDNATRDTGIEDQLLDLRNRISEDRTEPGDENAMDQFRAILSKSAGATPMGSTRKLWMGQRRSGRPVFNEDNSRTCLVHNLGKLTRVEKHDGVDYLVAPTVLICEGVHNNLYYPPDELAKFTEAWNGRPVVVFHPQNAGKAVTANSPAVWWGKGGSKVGYVFNTRWDAAAGKLRADIYVDPVKCREAGQHGKQAIDTLENEGPLEVSTGLFTELRQNTGGEIETGEWKGERYRGVAINHRPDHLALLPGLKGACSWDDGAGAPRVNAEANTEDVVDNAGTSEGAKKAWDTRGRGQKEEQESVASKFRKKMDSGDVTDEDVREMADELDIDPSDASGFSSIGGGWVSDKTVASDMLKAKDAGSSEEVAEIIEARFGMSAESALRDSSGRRDLRSGKFKSVKKYAAAITAAYEIGSGEKFKSVSTSRPYDNQNENNSATDLRFNEHGILMNAGTSEGAKKAWDTRGRGRKEESGADKRGASGLTDDEKSDLISLRIEGLTSSAVISMAEAVKSGEKDASTAAKALLPEGRSLRRDRLERAFRRLERKSVWDTMTPAQRWGASSRDRQDAAQMAEKNRYTLNADGVMVNANLSHGQLNETLSALICARFAPETVAQPGTNPTPCAGPYLVDVYDDCAIFACDGKIWSIEYTSGSKGVALDDGPAQEVQRVMSYEPVVNETCEFDDDDEDNEEESMQANAGTSEGAKKAWDTRGRGRKEDAKKEESVASKFTSVDEGEDSGVDSLARALASDAKEHGDKFTLAGVKDMMMDDERFQDIEDEKEFNATAKRVYKRALGLMNNGDEEDDEDEGVKANAGTSEGAKKGWDTRGRSMDRDELDQYKSFLPDEEVLRSESAQSGDDETATHQHLVKTALIRMAALRPSLRGHKDSLSGVKAETFNFGAKYVARALGVSAKGLPKQRIAHREYKNDSDVAGAEIHKRWKTGRLSSNQDELASFENNEATGDTGPHNNEETGMKDEGNKKASTEGAPVANAAPAAPVATPETLETVLAGIKDGGLRALVAEGVETAKAEKAKLVEKLAVNGAFTKDELEAMPTVNLRKIDVALAKAVETAKPVVNEPAGAVRVAAGAAPVVNAANAQGVPQMPGLFEKK